ncbi:TetR-like C-terminal domain-containing protein [Streptomyces sp. NPDC091271]|uniref:TetR-like C-terminal domain-containing protein n=1 Tax=Streptomyces sp. NPDC091271 TaxID=3365980 RepID=UPI00382BEAE5
MGSALDRDPEDRWSGQAARSSASVDTRRLPRRGPRRPPAGCRTAYRGRTDGVRSCPGVAPAVVVALVAAWTQLFGLISFELFGRFNRVVETREQLFRHAVHELGRKPGAERRGRPPRTTYSAGSTWDHHARLTCAGGPRV